MKTALCLLQLLALLVLLLTACSDSGTSPSDTAAALVNRAQVEKDGGNFTSARKLLREAQAIYRALGDNAAVSDCLSRTEDLDIIQTTYPYDLTTLRQELAKSFSTVPETEREAWISGNLLERITIDGKPYYPDIVISNIKYRNKELFRLDPGMYNRYKLYYDNLLPALNRPVDPVYPFSNPITYQGTGELDIPRAQLPATGLFRLWIPVPIVTATQPNVRIVSITPQKYVRQPPSIDQEIGLVYMEIPLEELTENLKVSVVFTFDHYEQHFVIDPARVGAYDKNGALYREYTASRGNTAITPEIAATARSVVGNETNPYLAARKLYQYVIGNIQYSYMPHLALWPRGEPESVYVHRNRYGDCGAQSTYFTALCRSLGIPARTTGGWQLIGGNFNGHFWAEFYLPNYGWIPVDPTASDMVDYLEYVSAEDNQKYHDFFFGSQDNMRAIVQRDVDLPLIPRTGAPIFFQMSIQLPTALCDTMDTDPTPIIWDHWTLNAQVLP